jgi:hypothetical protein
MSLIEPEHPFTNGRHRVEHNARDQRRRAGGVTTRDGRCIA